MIRFLKNHAVTGHLRWFSSHRVCHSVSLGILGRDIVHSHSSRRGSPSEETSLWFCSLAWHTGQQAVSPLSLQVAHDSTSWQQKSVEHSWYWSHGQLQYLHSGERRSECYVCHSIYNLWLFWCCSIKQRGRNIVFYWECQFFFKVWLVKRMERIYISVWTVTCL